MDIDKDDETTTELEPEVDDFATEDLDLNADDAEGVVGGTGGATAPHGPSGPGRYS